MRFENESIGGMLINLSNPGYVEAPRLCALIGDTDREECENLMLQTHRTLKAYVVATALGAFNINPSEMQSSKMMAVSYGIDSCLSMSPLDVCLFGNVSLDMILLTIVTCHQYRLQIFFSSLSTHMQTLLYSVRASFPEASVRWMVGPYASWFQPPHHPSCDILYIEKDYYADAISGHPTSSLLSRIPLRAATEASSPDKPVRIIISSALGTPLNPRPDHVLTHLLSAQGISIDWRLHTVTNTLATISNGKIDYYGKTCIVLSAWRRCVNVT